MLKAGIGGLLAITTVARLSHITRNSWLMAPPGASCVLLFSMSGSPLWQPANVIGGPIVSMATRLVLHALPPVEWWSMGLAVGLGNGRTACDASASGSASLGGAV